MMRIRGIIHSTPPGNTIWIDDDYILKRARDFGDREGAGPNGLFQGVQLEPEVMWAIHYGLKIRGHWASPLNMENFVPLCGLEEARRNPSDYKPGVYELIEEWLKERATPENYKIYGRGRNTKMRNNIRDRASDMEGKVEGPNHTFVLDPTKPVYLVRSGLGDRGHWSFGPQAASHPCFLGVRFEEKPE